MEGADPSMVSLRAIKRGLPQLGTLGAGNHFLEVQRVAEIFEPDVAMRFGIVQPDQIVVMIHSGSRGLGHQICSDYIKVMLGAASRYGIKLPDKELACAPLDSREAGDYMAAMFCAVNYAFANRQIMTHWVRKVFHEMFHIDEMSLVYDVCHNIAKIETHTIDGKKRTVCVHRKGCTRAFGPGRSEIPEDYRDIGQPVIIPGDMGTASYVLIGTERAMEKTFGTANHGAGRVMSRIKAKKTYWGSQVRKELEEKGILVSATSPVVLSEESPGAYKNISLVIEAVHAAGLSRKIVRSVPFVVTKG